MTEAEYRPIVSDRRRLEESTPWVNGLPRQLPPKYTLWHRSNPLTDRGKGGVYRQASDTVAETTATTPLPLLQYWSRCSQSRLSKPYKCGHSVLLCPQLAGCLTGTWMPGKMPDLTLRGPRQNRDSRVPDAMQPGTQNSILLGLQPGVRIPSKSHFQAITNPVLKASARPPRPVTAMPTLDRTEATSDGFSCHSSQGQRGLHRRWNSLLGCHSAMVAGA